MIVSWPPFLHLRLDASQYHLRKLAALAPLAVAAAICFGLPFVARWAVMTTFAALLQVVMSKRLKFDLKWSHVLYEAMLLSLLSPPQMSWQMAWVAPVLFLIFRWLIGGRSGISPLNVPALILGLLISHFGPQVNVLNDWPAPRWFGPAADLYFLCGALPAALSALVLILLLSNLLKFRLVASFAIPAFFLSALWWYNFGTPVTASTQPLVLLNAILTGSFFLANDEPSSPRAGWAQVFQGLVAALVFAFFLWRGLLYQAVIWSAFIPSLLSTWLDAASAYRSWLPRFPTGSGIQE